MNKKIIILLSIVIIFSLFVYFSNKNKDKTFNAYDLKRELQKNKATVKVENTNNSLLGAKEKIVKVGSVSILTYKFEDKESFGNAIERLEESKKYNVYEKERLLALYEGDNDIVISFLNSIMGQPIVKKP